MREEQREVGRRGDPERRKVKSTRLPVALIRAVKAHCITEEIDEQDFFELALREGVEKKLGRNPRLRRPR